MGAAGTSANARHYDRITRAWNIILGDDLHHGVFDDSTRTLADATRNLTRRLIDAAEIRAGERIVDLGCGTGGSACLVARECSAEVVGVSTSAVGLEFARQRAARSGVADRVSFQEVDALDTGLPAGSFDVAWSLESSQYLIPREAMMRECARLLAPGGRLVIADVVLTRPLELAELRRLHRDLSTLVEVFGEATMTTVDDCVDAAATVGLQERGRWDVAEQAVPTYRWWRERAVETREEVVELMGEPAWESFIAGCDVMEGLFASGVLSYAVFVLARPPAEEGYTLGPR